MVGHEMFFCIQDVLTEKQLAEIAPFFDSKLLVDGKSTAGKAGAEIKENLQVSPDSPDYAKLDEMVRKAVMDNRAFGLLAIPRRIVPIRFARYSTGMHYGKHIDNAVMGSDPPSRIDLAFTLFLSDPATYVGGELIVDDVGSSREFKLPAGSMVLYDGNSLHAVNEVTSGNRDVAVGWLQSMVRDPIKRRIIFELEDLRGSMLSQSGRTPDFDVLSRNIADLWRMWVDV
jgi:PKHD-type hydroxylase